MFATEPMHSIDVPAPQPGADAGEARWLAGDHHTHSRFSTGYDEKGSVANSDTVSKIGLMYCQGQLR